MAFQAKTKEQQESFKEAAKPLIKWLCENHNPHGYVVVSPDSAELVEGQMRFRCGEFIKD